jgi:hypothetical protein
LQNFSKACLPAGRLCQGMVKLWKSFRFDSFDTFDSFD